VLGDEAPAMQDDKAVGLRLGEELRQRERLARVRLDPYVEAASAKLELAHAAPVVRDVGARNELAHVVEGPAVVRRLPPVRERGTLSELRLH
jgi:hypothetical protein